MTPEQFAYWLQGFAEMCPQVAPNAQQWQAIRDHLNTVFHKITPDVKYVEDSKTDTVVSPPPSTLEDYTKYIRPAMSDMRFYC